MSKNSFIYTHGPLHVTFTARGTLDEIETVTQEFGEYSHITNRLPGGAVPGEEQDDAFNSLRMVNTAYMMAASPDMYELLKRLVDSSLRMDTIVRRAKAIVNKIEQGGYRAKSDE